MNILLLRVLQHVPLRAQVPKHSLPPRDILIQRGIRAREEILLPKRVVLPRHHLRTTTTPSPPPTHPRPAARVPRVHAPPRPTPARPSRVRIRVLGRRDVRPPVPRRAAAAAAAAEELVPVLPVQDLVARRLEGVDLPPVAGELGAEVADALVGLLLLGRVELLLREGVVLVDGLLEGRQGGAEGAQGGRAEDVVRRGGGGGGGRAGAVGGGGRVGVGGGGEGGEVGEVFADGGALLESTVESGVL